MYRDTLTCPIAFSISLIYLLAIVRMKKIVIMKVIMITITFVM